MAIKVQVLQASIDVDNSLSIQLDALLAPLALAPDEVGLYGFSNNGGGAGLVVVYDDLGAPMTGLAGSGIPTSYLAVMGEPTGFPNRVDTEFYWDDPTRTFGIQPKSPATFFDFYINGVKFTKTTLQTVVLSDTEGAHFVYFDTTGTLVCNILPWDFTQVAPVAITYWDVTNQIFLLLGDERHTTLMDGITRDYLHTSVGTRYVSGLAISDYVISGDGSDDAHVRFSLTSGVIKDEDISIPITHSLTPTEYFEQNLKNVANNAAEFVIAAKLGAAGELRGISPVQDIPVITADSTPATRIVWNEFTGGAWQLTEAGAGEFVAMWVIASHDIRQPITVIVGEHSSATLVDAQTDNTVADFNLGLASPAEHKVIYRLIFQTDLAFTNSVNAILVDIADFRTAAEFTPQSVIGLLHSGLPDILTSGHPAAIVWLNDTAGYFPVNNTEAALATLGGQVFDVNAVSYGRIVSVGAAGNFTVFKDAVDFLNAGSGGIIILIDASVAFGASDLDLSTILIKSGYVPTLPFSAKVTFDGTGHVVGVYTRLEGVQFELDATAPADSFIFDDAGLAVIIELSGQASLVINTANPNDDHALINDAGAPVLVKIYCYDNSLVKVNPADNGSWQVRHTAGSVDIYAMDLAEIYVDLDAVNLFEYDDSIQLNGPLTLQSTGTPVTTTLRSLGGFVRFDSTPGMGIHPSTTVDNALRQLEEKGFDVKIGVSEECADLTEALVRSNYKGNIIVTEDFTQSIIENTFYSKWIGATALGTMPVITFEANFGVSTLILENIHLIVKDTAFPDSALFLSSNPITIFLNNSILELDPATGVENNLAFFNKIGANTHKIYMTNTSKILCNVADNATRSFINSIGGGTSVLNVYCDQTSQLEGPISQLNLLRFDQIIDVSTSTGTPTSITGANRLTNSGSPPTVPTPRDGDRHFDVTGHRWFTYDSSRTKWLSDNVYEFRYGKSGSLGAGEYLYPFSATTSPSANPSNTAANAVFGAMTIVGYALAEDDTTIDAYTVIISNNVTDVLTLSPGANVTNLFSDTTNTNIAVSTSSNIGLRARIGTVGADTPENVSLVVYCKLYS